MLDFHEKRKLKSYMYSRPMVAALFLVCALFSVSVYHRYIAEREIAEKQWATEHELELLKQQATALEAEVNRLKSDRGVEAEIRDRYEVSKKGEKIVVVVGDKSSDNASTTTEIEKTEPEEAATSSFWKSLW